MKRPVVALTMLLVGLFLPTSGGQATSRGKLRVGFVSTAGAVPTTRTLEGEPLAGFLRAERELGIEGRVLYATQNPSQALASFARQRYDLVIDAFPYANPVDSVAAKFPRVRFLLVDAPFETLRHRPKNVQGSIYRVEEAGYLAGYLAALMEGRSNGKHVVSAVGGFAVPGVTRWTAGYAAGARKADPGIVVRIGYSNDFVNPAKCKRVALSQIAQGSGVVFSVAGACGLGALQAAKERGVWGIGVDVDQSYLGRHILTSAVFRLDRGVFDSARRLLRGRFTTGGNTIFDLRNGFVGLGRISPDVPSAFRRRVHGVRKAIIAGRIKVPRRG